METYKIELNKSLDIVNLSNNRDKISYCLIDGAGYYDITGNIMMFMYNHKGFGKKDFLYNIATKLKKIGRERKFNDIANIKYIPINNPNNDADANNNYEMHQINVTTNDNKVIEFFYENDDQCWYSFTEDEDCDFKFELGVLSFDC